MVTEINGHRDKRSSENMTQNGLNNNIKQTKCQGRHYLSICCYLVCAILLFNYLNLKALKTVYLYDCLS